ncbi:replication initiation protein, partial [Clostridium tarantellae]
MDDKKGLALVNTPNNIARGKIEIDVQINRLYYNILKNIQRDNRELIIKIKKTDILTPEQEDILKKIDTMSTLSCTLSKDEIDNIFKNNNYRTDQEIKERFNALQTAIFKFTTGETNSMVQLIGRVDYDNNSYTVQLDAKLYKYLFYNLEVGYTPVNLATLFNLQGQYAQNLYILLRGWTGTRREIEFTVEQLRENFKVGSKYKAYKDFKKRCILQAIGEINKTGSMIIDADIKERKKGRSVYAVTFEVTDLEPRFVQTIETKTVKDEQIFWFDNIEVDAKG